MSHKGLGCTSMNIQKWLQAKNIHCDVWSIAGGDDLENQIEKDKRLNHSSPAITHISIQAPWIPAPWMRGLSQQYPKIKFSVICHSNIGFLQAESNAIKLSREYADLALEQHNFFCAGNSIGFVRAIKNAWNRKAILLPNLYYLDELSHPNRKLWNGGVLRIGLFGATRVQKNFFSACVAALQIGNEMKAQLEIHMNGGRTDMPGTRDIVLEAAKAATNGLPSVKLVLVPWINSWPDFRKMVQSMHLLMQPSYTESFNNITADGIAEGVPSVVSKGVIHWAPEYWQASPDDFSDIARVGRHLLLDQYAARDGLECLHDYNQNAWGHWQRWLGV
jgi:hypothetical protein